MQKINKMKKIVSILFVLGVFWNVLSQSSENNLNTADFNKDCSGATDLCGKEVVRQSYDFSTSELDCESVNTSLYFYFLSEASSTNASWGDIYTNTTSSYKIYGPFSNFNDGCNLINNFEAPVAGGSSQIDTHHDVSLSTEENKYYILEITSSTCSGSISLSFADHSLPCGEITQCETCIPQFNPGPGKYIISAWVKQGDANPLLTNYTSPSLNISFPSVAVTYSFSPSGKIIDGWQRIEGIFEVPSGSNDLSLTLAVDQVACFFDDVRIFPFEGSMLSYVYDPITLKLVAEMDERNYAKIYEYDEEGKLIRVKKETEKGIMTIQENRENSVKK